MAVTVDGTLTYYALFMESLVKAQINFTSDIFYCMLCEPGYTPNQNAHQYKGDITNEVAVSTGYATGGISVPIGTITYTGSTKVLTINASNLVWPILTLASPGAQYGVIYDDTPAISGNDASKPLVGYVDFGSAQIFTDQALYINWPSTGFLTMGCP
jgi:hypothetical protein